MIPYQVKFFSGEKFDWVNFNGLTFSHCASFQNQVDDKLLLPLIILAGSIWFHAHFLGIKL